MRIFRRAVFLAAGLTAWAGSVFAADGSSLESLLGLIPEAPAIYTAAPIFSYVDLRAVERAAGVPAPASEAAFAALPPDARRAWADASRRVVAGPDALRNFGLVMQRSRLTVRESLGFDWFSVDRAIGFGSPPHTVTVLAGGPKFPGAADIGTALSRRDFTAETRAGVPVWHRLDDYDLALRLDDPYGAADVIAGRMPRAERIAVLPGLLVATFGWPELDSVLATRSGEAPAAAVATLLRAMTAAIGRDGTGEVVQAVAFALPSVGIGKGPADVRGQLFGQSGAIDADTLAARLAARASELPPYPIVLFLDIRSGDDTVAMIALPYGDRATAEAAAATVAKRLAAFVPAGATEPMLATLGAAPEVSVVDAPDVAASVAATFIAMAAKDRDPAKITAAREAAAKLSGGAVAVVAIRRKPAAAADTRGPAWVLARWLDAIYRRDFSVLAVP